MDLTPRLTCVASAVVLVICVVTLHVPQGAFSDPGWQLKAIQQYLGGTSPTPNTLVMADPKDLSRDLPGWISWWAPGTEIFAWPLMRLGISPGGAARLIAAGCCIFGALGWGIWISYFTLPRWAALATASFFPWIQYAYNPLFRYSAEALVFAFVPWTLLVTLRFAESRNRMLLASLGTGLMLGSLYVLKYSAAMVSVGAFVFLLTVFRKRSTLRLSLCGAAAALLILGLNVVNKAAGASMNLVTASRGLHLSLRTLLYGIANPALIMAGGDIWFRDLFRGAEIPAALAGFAGGSILLWLLWRYRPAEAHGQLARTVLAVSILALMTIWTVAGDSVSFQARHIAGAGLAVLPLALEGGFALARSGSRPLRWTLSACAICYLLLPLAYGLAGVATIIARQRGQAAGIARLYNPLISGDEVARIQQGFDPTTDVWYFTDPVLALDFDGRVVIRLADTVSGPELRAETFHTSKPVRMRLVLPRRLEDNGKAEIIRASFRGAETWQSCAPVASVQCWTSVLR